jgi:hypothetical protein
MRLYPMGFSDSVCIVSLLQVKLGLVSNTGIVNSSTKPTGGRRNNTTAGTGTGHANAACSPNSNTNSGGSGRRADSNTNADARTYTAIHHVVSERRGQVAKMRTCRCRARASMIETANRRANITKAFNTQPRSNGASIRLLTLHATWNVAAKA